jgi:hypothetical protein
MEAGGRIYMEGHDPVTTDLLEAAANSGMFLRTQTATLDAGVEVEGILEIRETDTIVLREVTNAGGPIRVIAGGEITAVRVECLADEKGNNVGLMTLSGDILVDTIGVGSENGQISLSSADDIWEVNDDPEVDLRGALGILYAQDKIDRGLERSFKPIHKWCKKQALCEFDRGRKLSLCCIQGDVELFFSLKNKVHVFATGTITVTYLDSHGRDISLRSKYEDIYVDYLHAEPCRGDVYLKADDAIHVAGELYSGETGQITAGDDLSIFAGDGIELYGDLQAGDDIKLVSGDGNVSIHGRVIAADRIDVYADEDLTITAPLEAGGDLDLYARGSLITTNASATLTAGVDVELETRWGDIQLSGAVHAGNGRTRSPDVIIDSGGWLDIYAPVTSLDDVEVWADDGLFMDAPVAAADQIEWGTCGHLTTSSDAPLTAGGDVDLYAGKIMILGAEVTAGDDVDAWAKGGIFVDGAVTAGDRLELGACGELLTSMNAPLIAGDDMNLYAREFLALGAEVTAGDDVDAWAKGGIFVDGTVTVGDRIKLGTCGSLTTTPDAPLIAGGDVELYAREWIAIGADVVAGDDVRVKSACGDVTVDGWIVAEDRVDVYAGGNLVISAGIVAGSDMDLYAKGSLTTTNEWVVLMAGVDVKLRTRWGDMELWGDIVSGTGETRSPDVLINSGGNLSIYGVVDSLDDVEIWADEGILIDNGVTAADNIKIRTCGSLTTTEDAALAAGKDMELFSRKAMSIHGPLDAGDDITITSCRDIFIFGSIRAWDDVTAFSCRDITLAGSIKASDRIKLSACDDLVLSAGSVITGLNGEEARWVRLWARDEMILEGTINAKKISIC